MERSCRSDTILNRLHEVGLRRCRGGFQRHGSRTVHYQRGQLPVRQRLAELLRPRDQTGAERGLLPCQRHEARRPRMDGFTFIKTIRAQDAYKDIPIIVLSTEGQEKDIQTGMSLGANLYMVKPAQPEKMVRNIKMLLG